MTDFLLVSPLTSLASRDTCDMVLFCDISLGEIEGDCCSGDSDGEMLFWDDSCDGAMLFCDDSCEGERLFWDTSPPLGDS